MCIIHQLITFTVSILQATIVASHSAIEQKRSADSIAKPSSRNIARGYERNAAGYDGTRANAGSPATAAASTFFVSKRRIIGRASTPLPNTISTAKLHSVFAQSAKPHTRLPKKSEFWNLFGNVRGIGWFTKSHNGLARVCSLVDFTTHTTSASMELIAPDEDSAPDNYAICQVDASSKTNFANRCGPVSALNSPNNSHISATSSAVIPHFVDSEAASELTNATANTTNHRHQFWKQHEISDASVNTWSE